MLSSRRIHLCVVNLLGTSSTVMQHVITAWGNVGYVVGFAAWMYVIKCCTYLSIMPLLQATGDSRRKCQASDKQMEPRFAVSTMLWHPEGQYCRMCGLRCKVLQWSMSCAGIPAVPSHRLLPDQSQRLGTSTREAHRILEVSKFHYTPHQYRIKLKKKQYRICINVI